jgi:predicted secreted protein
LISQIFASSRLLTALACCFIAAATLFGAYTVFDTSLTAALALYGVIWWVMIFVVLPFGVRSQGEAGDIIKGSEAGAPVAPLMGQKVLWTTILASLVFLGLIAFLRWVDF